MYEYQYNKKAYQNMKNRNFFVSSIFCFIILIQDYTVNAQTREIFGTVLNADSGEPVPDIKISIEGSKINTKSDAAGKFSMIVPDTLNTIEFSNFSNMDVQKVKFISSNIVKIYLTEKNIDIFKLTLAELMNLKVISATKYEQKVSEAPAVISVITALQIRQRGYATVAEALESISGIDVLNDHLQYNVGVRGNNSGMRAWSRIMKIMIDNQPISFRPTSENFLGEELIPISAVKRIEVIRGPLSALYGANAYLGIINIITKTGDIVNGADISGTVRSIQNKLAYGGNIIIGKKWEKINFVSSFSTYYSDRSGLLPMNVPDKTEYDNDSISSNDISKPMSIFTRLNIGNIEKVGLFSVGFNYQHIDKYGEFQDWAPLSHKNRISINNMYLRGQYQKKFTKKLNIHIQAAYSKGNPTNNEKLAINDVGYCDWATRDLGYNATDISTELGYYFNEFSYIRIGADRSDENQTLQTYYYNYYDRPSQPADGEVLGVVDFNNTGIYFQGVFHPLSFLNREIFKQTTLTAGLRYDIHNIYKNILNYRIGLVIPFNGNVYTKILYGTSFKAPASTQLYTTLLIPGDVIGNPELNPEEANTAELVLGMSLGKNLNLLINGYMTNIKNKVEFLKSGTNVYADNVNKINSLGFESELIYVQKNISGYLNFSYQRSTIVQDDDKNEDVFTKLYPGVMLKAGANYTIPKIFLNLNVEGQYIGARTASEQNIFAYDAIYKTEYSLDPYFLMNFTISTQNLKLIRYKETTFRFKIYNLLDTPYYYPGFNNFDIPGLNRYFTFSIIQNI